MEKVVTLVNKLQQICTSVGDIGGDGNSILWDKLVTIVVVGGQVSAVRSSRMLCIGSRSSKGWLKA